MDTSRLPEPLRARMAERDALPALEKVGSLLRGHVADTDGLEEVREELTMTARSSTRYLRQQLGAIETVLTEDLPAGTLLRLVEGDGLWPLDDDPTDAGAAHFLRELADLLSGIIQAADQGRL